MEQLRMYQVSAIKDVVKESAKEFQPVFGKNVEKDNKEINDKAYKESEKRTQNYDGGVRNTKKKLTYPETDNKGMQDLEYDNMSPEFAKRVKAQMKGYVSAEAEKKHKDDDFGNAEHNEIEGMDKRAKAFKKGKDVASEIGLTGRELDKKDIEGLTKTIFDESKKYTKITFKNTEFINEGHMLTKVPDDFKVEGRQFIMRDKFNHEYLVEWREDERPYVLSRNKINEQNNRIQQLFKYQYGSTKTTNDIRLNEDKNIGEMLGKIKSLMK